MTRAPTIGVGLYGANGHQIGALLPEIEGARLTACCQAGEFPGAATVACYEHLADLLADPNVDLVSLCSPVRAEQAADIRRALRAGKHVYAEKPCVMALDDLESIPLEARRHGVECFEMAGTAFEAPYAAVRPIVASGELGEIAQIQVQKSYPYANWRPQDESVDGGLILQVGIHAMRLIEHAAGQRIPAISAIETGVGNPVEGALRMAAIITCRLAGGGIAGANLNYLNQPGIGGWGFEELKIFGSRGLLIADLPRGQVRVVQGEHSRIIAATPPPPYFQQVITYLRGLAERPLDVATETHPTRAAIRAKESAARGGIVLPV